MRVARLGLLIVLLNGLPGVIRGQQPRSATELVEKFKSTGIFWQQLEAGRRIVEIHDGSILPQLESWLRHDDRHVRGNAAFIAAALGNRRGFDVIIEILNDRSNRGEGQGIPTGRWSLEGQIAADRYYEVHLLGELKDPRAVSSLVVQAMQEKSPDVRVITIESLGKLNAKETLPDLRSLLDDNEPRHFGSLLSVAAAARAAIAKLEPTPTLREL
jgi:HEAT repeat protein